MNVTTENFEEAFIKSLELLDAYAATQVTEAQKLMVVHEKRHITVNKDYFFGLLQKGKYVAFCNNCGTLHTDSYMKPHGERIRESGMCFVCCLWKFERVAETKPNRLIINGQIYTDGGNKPGADSNRVPLGFAGHIWKIERDGEVWETNNLWSGGTIPQEHRAALPDNARFVK
jgi:hypothetical protein